MDDDTQQTIIMTWVCTWLSEVLMMVRLIMRKVRRQKFDLGDGFTMAAMAFLIIRLAMVHVVLIWGTNNVTASFRASNIFTTQEIYQREVGSKLTLAVRTVYNMYAWLQKGVVMLLYKRMFSGLIWMDTTMKIYWAILGATFVVAQVVTFTECNPFYLYWQVLPDPGICVEALIQLLVLGLVTIVTDVMLIILPMPALLKVRLSTIQKLELIGLFSIGFVLVAMTIARLDINFSSGAQQVNRTEWASAEAFASAFVANTPTLYTLRKRRDPRESTFGTRGEYGVERSGIGRQGITVIRSFELDVQDENPKISADSVAIRRNDAWDKQIIVEDLIHVGSP